jgi:type IX secretion system PorP/SprF family membrane protein
MPFNSKRLAALFLLLATMAATKTVLAQVNNFQSGYFTNQYLTNPAMAGLVKGLQFNLALRQQFTTVPGSPKMQNLTADYAAGDNVGIGLNINNDKTGLISRTRVMGTYAYHLPVSESSRLNFGLSLGVNDTYLDNNSIVGDGGDVSADLFKPAYFIR